MSTTGEKGDPPRYFYQGEPEQTSEPKAPRLSPEEEDRLYREKLKKRREEEERDYQRRMQRRRDDEEYERKRDSRQHHQPPPQRTHTETRTRVVYKERENNDGLVTTVVKTPFKILGSLGKGLF